MPNWTTRKFKNLFDDLTTREEYDDDYFRVLRRHGLGRYGNKIGVKYFVFTLLHT